MKNWTPNWIIITNKESEYIGGEINEDTNNVVVINWALTCETLFIHCGAYDKQWTVYECEPAPVEFRQTTLCDIYTAAVLLVSLFGESWPCHCQIHDSTRRSLTNFTQTTCYMQCCFFLCFSQFKTLSCHVLFIY